MPFLRRLLICLVLMPVFFASLFAQSPDFAETKKRAEAGDAKAQFELGGLYYNGTGVPEGLLQAEALKWYRKAAEQGYASAQMSLGMMYARGEGVPENDVEAVKWWRKAADLGNAEAQYNLGFMYKDGNGVPQDHAEAYAWFNISAVSYEPAKMLKKLLRLTPEERERGQKRSTELFNEIEARKKKAGQ